MQALVEASLTDYRALLSGIADENMSQAKENADESEANLPRRRRMLSPNDYVSGVLAGDRGLLARAITLVESTSPLHEAQAQEVLQRLDRKSTRLNSSH